MGVAMFKKRWPWLGRIVSEEGFEISFAHKTVYYSDGRGKFALGHEDGLLFRNPYPVSGNTIALSQTEVDQMVERVLGGIQWEGLPVQVFTAGQDRIRRQTT
jgi:hypothetical protein